MRISAALFFVFTGLAVALPFAVGLFNVGAEGQAILGALGCAVVAQAFIPSGGLAAASAGLLVAAVLEIGRAHV